MLALLTADAEVRWVNVGPEQCTSGNLDSIMYTGSCSSAIMTRRSQCNGIGKACRSQEPRGYDSFGIKMCKVRNVHGLQLVRRVPAAH